MAIAEDEASMLEEKGEGRATSCIVTNAAFRVALSAAPIEKLGSWHTASERERTAPAERRKIRSKNSGGRNMMVVGVVEWW